MNLLRRILEILSLRLPIALLTSAVLCLWLSLPLFTLDSDSAVFGLMGEDLIAYGRFPTLMYGQTHFISLTPYTHALVRLLLPALAPAPALVLGGAILSLAGLWLVYEALLVTLRRQSQSAAPAAVAFCLLMAASPGFILDLGRNSGNEISVFLVGLFFFAATRIEALPGASAGRAWLLLLGLASGYALCSRPNTLPYALALGVPLSARALLAPPGRPRRLLALGYLVAGFGLGYLPMILHWVARGRSWPFAYGFRAPLASPGEAGTAARVVATEIMPSILQLDRGGVLRWVAVCAWAGVALGALTLAVLRRWRQLSAADLAWPLGTMIVLGLMIAFPRLALNAECRRYALPASLALVWTFCRFCLPRSPFKWAAWALVAAVAFASGPLWSASLAQARREDDARRQLASEVASSAAQSGAILLADYSDAYLLRLIAGGRLPIEAYPWQVVRTYGFLRPADFDRPLALFLSRTNSDSGARHMQRFLARQLGAEAMASFSEHVLTSRLDGRQCRMWMLADGRAARDLLARRHPLYLATVYPP